MSLPLVDKTWLLDPARFWQAACQFYTVPGSAAICLELQDGAFAFNVNVILLALDFEQHDVALSDQDFHHIDQAIEAWQTTVLRPLRCIRRQVKSQSDATYSALKSAELEAERVEQMSILKALAERPLAQRIDAQPSNLMLYARHRGAQNVASLQEKLADLERLVVR